MLVGMLFMGSILFCGAAWAVSVDDITYMTENYPPYNYSESEKLQGFAVDLLEAMLQKVGSKKTRKDIQLLPWARGYKSLQEDQNTCLFSMTRTPARENLFKWVGPIFKKNDVLIAKKDRHIKIGSVEDVHQYKIGTVIEDAAEQVLVEKGIPWEKLDRMGGTTDVIINSIKKLDADRIDLFSYEMTVASWEMIKAAIDPSQYEPVYTLREGEVYYAFHKATPDTVIRTLQNALDELKKSGEHAKIIEPYLLLPKK
jgi:polar amino acid transport system substrate-binding protein